MDTRPALTPVVTSWLQHPGLEFPTLVRQPNSVHFIVALYQLYLISFQKDPISFLAVPGNLIPGFSLSEVVIHFKELPSNVQNSITYY